MEPIAIVGIGCRFPGAHGSGAFWQLLVNNVDAISEVPDNRWRRDDFYAEDSAAGKTNTCAAGFVENVERFDAKFFGVSPREAHKMDPQQRILLETVWEALEDAGIVPDTLRGSQTGVYVGVMGNEWAHEQMADVGAINMHTGSGSGYCLTANRVSYHFDLRGPSMAVDTACSSSLVAAHLAAQALRLGDIDTAIVGGVNLMLSPALNIFYTQAGLSAADGRCKSFSANADGIGRGEGTGVVILMRLADAQAAQLPIYALLHGSAVNQDGRSNGLTAPSRWAQEAVLKAAYRQAKCDPSQVRFLEAHGTGTKMGDPIEINALKAVIGPYREPDKPCYLGSVKSNIGHLEGAAGVAGLIKTALALKHGVVPASLHCAELNPLMKMEKSGLEVLRSNLSLANEDADTLASPCIAGVSSFGLGGTNAHVVLGQWQLPMAVTENGSEKEAELAAERAIEPTPVLALSAKTPESLECLARSYADLIEHQDATNLSVLCASANYTRSHFKYRFAVPVTDKNEVLSALRGFNAAEDSKLAHDPSKRKIAFLFSGQGSQYSRMGVELFEQSADFRDDVLACDALFIRFEQHSLLPVLFPKDDADQRIHDTRYTQPALFVLQYALTKHWRRMGVLPDVVMGHSVGEFAAAVVAGALSLEDGLRLVATRGRLMSALPQTGAMLAILQPAQLVRRLMAPFANQVAIAAFNGPSNTVLSGDRVALDEIVVRLDAENISYRWLTTSHAFHSPLMGPMLADFAEALADINWQQPNIALISNVTGKVLDVESLTSTAYWLRHTREPVHFMQGVERSTAMGCDLYLEIGPQPVLCKLARRCTHVSHQKYIGSLHQGEPATHGWAKAVSALYRYGVLPDLNAYCGERPAQAMALPTYAFYGDYYWQRPSPTFTASADVSNAASTDIDTGTEITAEDGTSRTVKNTEHEINTDILTVIATIGGFKLNDIQPKQRLQEDLGFDSMLVIELKNKLEKQFLSGEKIPVKALFAIQTVADVITFIDNHKASLNAA